MIFQLYHIISVRVLFVTIDPEDPEYMRQMRRPVEVKEDVRRMEERQRVKRILHSKAFRDELEELVVELQIGNSTGGPAPVSSRLPLNAIQTQPTLIGRGLIQFCNLCVSH